MKLNIPKPCSENWQDMTPEEKGRFCQLCQKVVIDFTEKSDKDIVAFFQQNQQSVCGRVLPMQLKSYPEPQKDKKGFPILRAAATGMLFAASLGIASAQPTDSQQNRERIQISQFHLSQPQNQQTDRTSKQKDVLIQGKVFSSETKKPLFGVQIQVKGTSFQALSNGLGEYQLTIPASVGTEVTLVFSYLDTHPSEVDISTEAGLSVTVVPQYIDPEIPIPIVGEIIMGRIRLDPPPQKDHSSGSKTLK
ncbi:MAG: carboxypeptidase-like regulatory domain-containing protein [Bacteroidota bacterium]